MNHALQAQHSHSGRRYHFQSSAAYFEALRVLILEMLHALFFGSNAYKMSTNVSEMALPTTIYQSKDLLFELVL